jgi:pilus assembly protein Flp/PilA
MLGSGSNAGSAINQLSNFIVSKEARKRNNQTPGPALKRPTEDNMIKQFLRDESGQDLIEYVLIIAVIAFAACVGMGTVASKINGAFANVGVKLDTYVK